MSRLPLMDQGIDMRTIAAATIILAGIVGLGLGEIANAIGKTGAAERYSYAGGDIKLLGSLMLILGGTLLIVEYSVTVREYFRRVAREFPSDGERNEPRP